MGTKKGKDEGNRYVEGKRREKWVLRGKEWTALLTKIHQGQKFAGRYYMLHACLHMFANLLH